MAHQDTTSVKALDRTFKIVKGLEMLGEAGVSELATHLGYPPSTTYTHLNTLKKAGYVVKGDDATYRLSFRFLEVGGHLRQQQRLFNCARLFADELAKETGDLVNLMIPEGHHAVHLYIAKGRNGVELDTYPGKRIPFHTTGNGKAMLAHFSDERIEEIIDEAGLPRQTKYTITDRDSLFEEIETIREQGYAIDDAERLVRLRCVGAPILVDENTIIGGLSVSGPTSRMEGEHFEELPQKVVNVAERIEIDYEYSES